MLDKISVLARLLNILLAIVAGLVAIPGLDVTLALVVLGLITGITMKNENFVTLAVAVVALPAMAGALGSIPSVGTYLAAIFNNFAVAVAASVAMAFALGTYQYAKADSAGLLGGGKSGG